MKNILIAIFYSSILGCNVNQSKFLPNHSHHMSKIEWERAVANAKNYDLLVTDKKSIFENYGIPETKVSWVSGANFYISNFLAYPNMNTINELRETTALVFIFNDKDLLVGVSVLVVRLEERDGSNS